MWDLNLLPKLSFPHLKMYYNNSLNRQQPLTLLYSIEIWPARNSRLTQRETNHYITRCASVFAWSYLAGRSPKQLVIDLCCTASAICCMLSIWNSHFDIRKKDKKKVCKNEELKTFQIKVDHLDRKGSFSKRFIELPTFCDNFKTRDLPPCMAILN